MEYKIILGIVAVAVGLISYAVYFRSIFYGRTKPHMFSWLVWGLLEGTAFFAQLSSGGGSGAWVTGATAALCFVVFAAALKKGEKQITRLDWYSLLGAFLGLALWGVTSNPLIAVIIVSATDFLGFVPTFRKSYHKPHEEAAMLYFLSIVKLVFALFALESFNPTTAIYPATLVLTNAAFVAVLLVRRRSTNL